MSLFDTTWSIQVEKILPPVLRDRTFSEKNDDFLTGDGENNYIEYILVSYPGHWKEQPVVGVGIWSYLLGTQSPQVLARAIDVGLRADIFIRPQIDIKDFPVIRINNVTITING